MEINSGLFVILACVGIYIILCVLCICNKNITNICIRTVAHGTFRSDSHNEGDSNRTVMSNTNGFESRIPMRDTIQSTVIHLDVPPTYEDVCKSETPPPPYKQLIEPSYREVSKRMEPILF